MGIKVEAGALDAGLGQGAEILGLPEFVAAPPDVTDTCRSTELSALAGETALGGALSPQVDAGLDVPFGTEFLVRLPGYDEKLSKNATASPAAVKVSRTDARGNPTELETSPPDTD